MAEFDYREKMVSDLLEQFRGKHNIKVLVESYAAQLEEVYEFLLSLLTLLDLDACTGVQLDLIGDIVALSRYDAVIIAGDEYTGNVMDDDLYRKMLKWKVLLNTNDCTYWSIVKGIKYFWDKSEVYYHTDPEVPATIFIETPPLSPSVDPSYLYEIPIIRPGGVDLRLTVTTQEPVMIGQLRVASGMWSIEQTTLPEMAT